MVRRRLAAYLYWLFTMLVFIVDKYNPTEDFGIPVLVVTLPWSVLAGIVYSLLQSVQFLQPVFNLLHGNLILYTAFEFIVFPVLCGGLNAAIIYGVFRHRQTERPR